MQGMNASTGKPISDEAHLAQSIGKILSTPLGSRAMRRDFGSLLFELIDKPINGAIRMLLQAATAIALRRWEPRIRLTRVTLSGEPAAGRLIIRIEGLRTDLPPSNALVALTIPFQARPVDQSGLTLITSPVVRTGIFDTSIFNEAVFSAA